MENRKRRLTLGRVIFTSIYTLIVPVLLLFISGDWLWVEGWIFGIFFTVMCFTSAIYLYLKDPSLLAERYKASGASNQKGWDRYLVLGILIGLIAWIVIMPLDSKRFGWTSSFPFGLKIVGVAALFISFFFFIRSYMDNTFLSPMVRIQNERKQQVISTGVYGFVRHPLYLGDILLFEGTPLLLGSIYGIIIGFILALLLVGRIIGEEKMLTIELEGYVDYKKKVKYRLIPFVW